MQSHMYMHDCMYMSGGMQVPDRPRVRVWVGESGRATRPPVCAGPFFMIPDPPVIWARG
jgi:hypothetical protein